MALSFLWMSENGKHGLRVAPLVMTGCLRVLMTVSGERKVDKIKSAIVAFKEFYKVQTVADDIEIENLGKWVDGPKQVTDAHLLAIAERHKLKLLTFDKQLPSKNVLLLD